MWALREATGAGVLHNQRGDAQPKGATNAAGGSLARQDGNEGGHHVDGSNDHGVQERCGLAGAQGVEDDRDLQEGLMRVLVCARERGFYAGWHAPAGAGRPHKRR